LQALGSSSCNEHSWDEFADTLMQVKLQGPKASTDDEFKTPENSPRLVTTKELHSEQSSLAATSVQRESAAPAEVVEGRGIDASILGQYALEAQQYIDRTTAVASCETTNDAPKLQQANRDEGVRDAAEPVQSAAQAHDRKGVVGKAVGSTGRLPAAPTSLHSTVESANLLFDALDTNQDGVLDRSELIQGYDHIFAAMTDGVKVQQKQHEENESLPRASAWTINTKDFCQGTSQSRTPPARSPARRASRSRSSSPLADTSSITPDIGPRAQHKPQRCQPKKVPFISGNCSPPRDWVSSLRNDWAPLPPQEEKSTQQEPLQELGLEEFDSESIRNVAHTIMQQVLMC